MPGHEIDQPRRPSSPSGAGRTRRMRRREASRWGRSASSPCRARSRAHAEVLARRSAPSRRGPHARRPRRRRRPRAARRRVDDDVDAARVVRACSTRSPSASPTGMPAFGTCAGMILLGAEIARRPAPTSAASAPSTSPCAATPSAARSTRFEADLAVDGPRRRRRSTPCSSGRRSSSGPAPTSRCWPPSTATRCCAARARSLVAAFHPELSRRPPAPPAVPARRCS